MLNYSGNDVINIGVGKDSSISEIADLIKSVVNYKGQIKFDTSKPDGTKRKLLDISKATKIGWSSESELYDDLSKTYLDFVENYTKYKNK